MTATAILQTIGSALLVVASMLATGLRLRAHELGELRHRPLGISWSVLVNVVLLPALACLATWALALPVEVSLGVLLCAAAPGGPTSALYSNTARADLAFAAGMTILLPAIGVIATPLILAFAVELPADASVPVVPMVGTLIVLQMAPLAAGMLVRRRNAVLADRLAPAATKLANATLGLLVVMLLVLKGELLLGISGATYVALFGLIGVALLLGYLGERRDPASARAGALVAGCRNISVSIMLASTFFVDPVTDATVLAFGFLAVVLPLALASWWRRSVRP
jgi:BASS family bile acid:Na+ symporter